ncbi:MAG: hypothetical protein ACK5IQ_09795 [Bacteroidales bacterium]
MNKKYENLRKMKALSIFIIAVSLLACSRQAEKTKEVQKEISAQIDTFLGDADTAEPADEVVSEIPICKDKINEIDFDDTEVYEIVYVSDMNGAQIKQQQSRNSRTLGHYIYGERLNVIEHGEEWYGIREKLTRTIVRDGGEMTKKSWEKVYVLKSKVEGGYKEIKLSPSDLYIVYGNSPNKDSILTDEYFNIELINEDRFLNRELNAVSFLLTDTLKHKKKNGTISLECRDSTVEFVDKVNMNDGDQEFRYLGQIEFLNSYVVYGLYWENYKNLLIDKTTGENVSFQGFPYVSPDKQYIIDFIHIYDESTLVLYSISNKKIEKITSVSFKNWCPDEPDRMFWSNDNCFYVQVVSSWEFDEKNYNDRNKENNIPQYVRIKVLK